MTYTARGGCPCCASREEEKCDCAPGWVPGKSAVCPVCDACPSHCDCVRCSVEDCSNVASGSDDYDLVGDPPRYVPCGRPVCPTHGGGDF